MGAPGLRSFEFYLAIQQIAHRRTDIGSLETKRGDRFLQADPSFLIR
jgi:hypothetical protein